jgi:hypothetical protein
MYFTRQVHSGFRYKRIGLKELSHKRRLPKRGVVFSNYQLLLEYCFKLVMYYRKAAPLKGNAATLWQISRGSLPSANTLRQMSGGY